MSRLSSVILWALYAFVIVLAVLDAIGGDWVLAVGLIVQLVGFILLGALVVVFDLSRRATNWGFALVLVAQIVAMVATGMVQS
jgi:hypothetical protein